MSILYYGIEGSAPDLVAGWIFVGLAAIVLISFIVLAIILKEPSTAVILLFIIPLLAVSFNAFNDSRVPIVKATVDDQIPWQTITEKYELQKQEGLLYTFKVKNVSLEEWEKVVEVQCSF